MRLLLLSSLLLAACAPPPPKAEAPKPDPTAGAAYADAVAQLASLARQAEVLGVSDEAAAVITKSQPLIAQVLATPHPTLAAMEASSDLDHLYGRMLLANKNYGWARMQFQKNRSRWMNWRPQTDDTARRKRQADDAIAECDRALSR